MGTSIRKPMKMRWRRQDAILEPKSNIYPEDLAALSRSTTIKCPAWPEGADWSDWRGCCV